MKLLPILLLLALQASAKTDVIISMPIDTTQNIDTIIHVIDTIYISQPLLPPTIPKKWYQPLFEKNDFVSYGAQYFSGLFTGVREQLLYHPDAFHKEFPNLPPQWWDNRISWENKYNESPLLVAFSDGNHFFKAATLVSNCISVGFTFGDINSYQKKDRWKVIVKKIVFSYLINKAGFLTSYNIILKNHL